MTEWGVMIFMVCGLVLPILGQADYAVFLSEEQPGIIEWLGALGNVIGGFMAFYGRLRAVKKLTK